MWILRQALRLSFFQNSLLTNSYSFYFVTMQQNFVTCDDFKNNMLYVSSMAAGGRPTKKERPELGERIAEARELAGLSQHEVARQLGVAQQSVVSWERRVQAIRSDTLKKLALLYRVSTDELLGIKPLKRKTPKGRVGQIVEGVSKLPRRQQSKAIEAIENMLSGYKSRQDS